MAGIGFELRKLYREEGIVQNMKAYAYSSMTTIGPMILCLILVFVQQIMMKNNGSEFLENELFVATMAYCFIFSIIVTSGVSMVMTRFVADMIYQQKYEKIISSFYGALIVMLPVAGILATLFLYGVDDTLGYKIAAYLFFIELVIIWLQNVYLSALKDYKRIVKGFAIGVVVALAVSFCLFLFTSLNAAVIALLGIDIGFGVIVGMTMLHFEQMFPRDKKKDYFAFLSYFKKFPIIFYSGLFVYSGVYIHNFVYWIFSGNQFTVANRFFLNPLYDVPVFYAYISVLPSLIMFVVIVETDFYEKFVNYYRNVIDGGTYESMNNAKNKMKKVLLNRIGFLVEVQLLFTSLSIASGIIYLPRIGFSMEQLDLFILLCLGYFFFIIMFVLLHALMYFDDRKGVLWISALFVVLNGVLSYVSLKLEFDGLGMFLASFIVLVVTIIRLMSVLSNIYYYTFCSQPLTHEVKKQKSKSILIKPVSTLLVLIGTSLMLSACSDDETQAGDADTATTEQQMAIENTSNNDKLVDDVRVYEEDVDGSVKSLYITVLPEQSSSLDWYTLNRSMHRYIKNEETLNVIFSEGTENGTGPKEGMFGFGTQEANAAISLRGNTSRSLPQKSYKIKLFDSAGLWQDQRTISLNKHVTDLSRLRNKLSFDLMEGIPHMTSLRTQFVHLYVKDLTVGNNTAYEDYGLYTQIEQPNKMFLKNHLLDPNGYLYKAKFFEFGRYPDQVKSHLDAEYDKASFETILEIKGREEHEKLIEMIEDVNNTELMIEDVIDKHFDLDNLLTWTAVNILMDNMDTDAHNFYLYSPLNSEKWFILPWDYDGGWELQRNHNFIRPYQSGISNFWGNRLLNRYFRKEENIEKLIEKVEEVSTLINAETVEAQLAEYKDVVKPFLFREPDVKYLPGENTAFEDQLQQFINTPVRAKERFYEDLEKPKPFYMWDVLVSDSDLTLIWDISFDLQMDDLFYSVTVATDPTMENVIAHEEGIRENEFKLKRPANGTYYWSVKVKDSKGNEQVSFDMYTDNDGNEFYNIQQFEVE